MTKAQFAEASVKVVSRTVETIAEAFEAQGDTKVSTLEVAKMLRESFSEEALRDAIARGQEFRI